jgi:hypothetical protein
VLTKFKTKYTFENFDHRVGWLSKKILLINLFGTSLSLYFILTLWPSLKMQKQFKQFIIRHETQAVSRGVYAAWSNLKPLDDQAVWQTHFRRDFHQALELLVHFRRGSVYEFKMASLH